MSVLCVLQKTEEVQHASVLRVLDMISVEPFGSEVSKWLIDCQTFYYGARKVGYK